MPSQNGTNYTNNTWAMNISAPTNNSLPHHIDLTPILQNFTITNTSRWTVSQKCDRFAVDNVIFFRNGNDSNFRPILLNQTVFNPSSYNQNLTWALFDNAVWRLDPLTNAFLKELQI